MSETFRSSEGKDVFPHKETNASEIGLASEVVPPKVTISNYSVVDMRATY